MTDNEKNKESENDTENLNSMPKSKEAKDHNSDDMINNKNDKSDKKENENDPESEDAREDNENQEKKHLNKNKTKKNRIYAGIAVLALIVIILLAVFLPKYNTINTNSQTKIKQYIYRGFVFNRSMSLLNQSVSIWSTEFNLGNQTYQADFYYDPLNLTDIMLPKAVNSSILLNRTQIYITLQSNLTGTASIPALEIGKITGVMKSGSIYGIYGISTIFTVMNNSESPQYLQVTCQNASSSILVFQLMPGNNTISYNNNCIIVKADNYTNLLRESDRIAYALLNIMN